MGGVRLLTLSVRLRAPYGPPASQGDGRSVLCPYGLAFTYPSQGTSSSARWLKIPQPG